MSSGVWWPSRSDLRAWARTLLPLALAVSTLCCPRLSAAAQIEDGSWTPPVRIGRLSHDDANPSPTAIVDGDGTIHVFWIDRLGDEPVFVINYTRQEGGAWAQPVEIIAPPYMRADQLHAALDDRGDIHLIWRSRSDLYHSQAHVSQVLAAQSWAGVRRIPLDQDADGLSFHVSAGGRMDLVYTDGVVQTAHHIYSTDYGASWSMPTLVGETPPGERPPEMALSTTDVQRDGRGRLHVVWTNKIPQRAYYARSDDDGATWTSPLELPAPADHDFVYQLSPTVVAVGDDVIHVSWLGAYYYSDEGTVPAKYRFHIWSADGGASWSNLANILEGVQGHNGPNSMVVDSTGTVHLISVGGFGPGAIHWVEYIQWRGRRWSEMFLVPGTRSDQWSVDGPAASHLAISTGNRLHVVWRTNDEGMWYSTRQVDSPYVASLPVPTARPAAAPTVVPAADSGQTTGHVEKPEAERSAALGEGGTPDGPPSRPLLPVLIGVVPALGIVILFLVLTRLRRN